MFRCHRWLHLVRSGKPWVISSRYLFSADGTTASTSATHQALSIAGVASCYRSTFLAYPSSTVFGPLQKNRPLTFDYNRAECLTIVWLDVDAVAERVIRFSDSARQPPAHFFGASNQNLYSLLSSSSPLPSSSSRPPLPPWTYVILAVLWSMCSGCVLNEVPQAGFLQNLHGLLEQATQPQTGALKAVCIF